MADRPNEILCDDYGHVWGAVIGEPGAPGQRCNCGEKVWPHFVTGLSIAAPREPADPPAQTPVVPQGERDCEYCQRPHHPHIVCSQFLIQQGREAATRMSKDATPISKAQGERDETLAFNFSHYFGKGRCSGHDQFNGRYCRDAAGPEQWCIHCAGYMLLTRLRAASPPPETPQRAATCKHLFVNVSAEGPATCAWCGVAQPPAAGEGRGQ